MEISLIYIYGIGSTLSRQALARNGVDPNARVRDLSDEEVRHLRDLIYANCRIEGALRREVQQNIERKVDIGCYQGIRHRRGLSVRGQRTHTNARTRKGARRTVGGLKRKIRK